jgi:ATP-dependent helicase HepA
VADFVPGQRWISDTELDMGLGTVMSVDQRSVKIVFLATGETRVYAKQTAPLTRARFSPGDTVKSHEGWNLTIETFQERDGLFTYVGTTDGGEPAELPEGQLDNFIQLSRPTDRLFSGQIDANKWFSLRAQTLEQNKRLAHSDLRGLTGGRIGLIPHQLYIAHEVANRYAPRVLLADEVGLGKTIEAGMILHHQLLTERARRVLIVVPETLLHQWLVEMLRRFNLHFSIYDEERCLADEESSAQDNPFHTEQLALCSLEFLTQYPNRFHQALQGSWDLLVVDEAHHLQWTPTQPSTEYQIIENLAQKTKGVLLLTATPEQLGKESHFARLRLLDADRFPDFNTFLAEEDTYEPIAKAVEELLENTLNDDSYKTLLATIDEDDHHSLLALLTSSAASEAEKSDARLDLVEHLLDRHGTGRVLFRNTRAAVKGFPDRQVSPAPLPLPEEYQRSLADFELSGVNDAQVLLSTELLYQQTSNRSQPPWHEIDPRMDWLITKLKALKPRKVLILAASAKTALQIAESLRVKAGIHAAVFHEGLSIVERDRAAAYFADQETGSQALICSEIGSEGRNFQFAHHLILFDLPLNPDLLEQRIGRLDRIGQTDTIQIHVPYLDNSPQAIMFHWYHEGLNAFEHTCPAGHTVFVQAQTTLIEALHQYDEGLEDLAALIDTTKTLHQKLNNQLQRGRDRLLEYNSCRPKTANAIKNQAQQQDKDTQLQDYLDKIFDCFGVDVEEHSKDSLILHPGPYMQIHSFPGLSDEGMTITFNRDTALANEDMRFMTWEHPLVGAAMEMILSGEQGNTALTAIKHKAFNPGTLLLETIYVISSAASDELQSSRYLPPAAMRFVLDSKGKNLNSDLAAAYIDKHSIQIPQETAHQVIRSQGQQIRELVFASDQLAQQQAPAIIDQAHQQAGSALNKEINRLKALQLVNPNIRNEEIDFFETQLAALNKILEAATPRLDAVRVIITM